MAETDSKYSEHGYNSYADYVQSVGDLNDNGLVDFLQEGSTKFRPSTNPNTDIYILDSVNNTLESHHFNAPRRGPVDQSFLDLLCKSEPQMRTRLVLLQFRNIGDINNFYIDAIGLHYMLEPYFLSAHFGGCRERCRRSSDMRPRPPFLLPSERRFLQVITNKDSHMTATWKITGDHCTIIMIEQYLYGPTRISMMRDELLRYDETKISRLDKSPADYLLPYLKLSARYATVCYAQNSRFSKSVNIQDWKFNQEIYRSLITSLDGLTNFVEYFEWELRLTKTEYQTLLRDYATLIESYKISGLDIQSVLQQEANSAAIEETKRGIKQGDSVRRLTLVASVFIPLNFATSFCGMNIEQLGTGRLHIGYFFLLAVLAGGLCLILSGSLRPLEALWMEARRQHVLREFKVDDANMVARVTKRKVIWGYIRHYFPLTQMLHNSREDANWDLVDEISDRDDPDDVSFSRILWHPCKRLLVRLLQKLIKSLRQWIFKSSTDAAPGTSET